MKNCEDCGCKVYSGYCVNCNEEHFIEEQCIELNIPIPDSIYLKSREDDIQARARLKSYSKQGELEE